jgi:hypothetical protein
MESLMKKKTVITTEKLEVWVIREGSDKDVECSQDSLIPVLKRATDLLPTADLQTEAAIQLGDDKKQGS